MKISVVVTSYNQKKYLVQTLDSVLAQTLMPFEIIVCDDASTDGSQELIRAYVERYPGLVKPIHQPRNLGVTRNRNTGIKAAVGDYITTLDGDDLYLPEKLEKELQKSQESGASLVYSNVIYIDAAGRETGRRYKGNRQLEGVIFEKIATFKYPAPREVLIARECIDAMGVLDERFRINEDFEWIVRLASRYPFAAVNEPLVRHRYHAQGLHRSDRIVLLETLAAVTVKMRNLCRGGLAGDSQKAVRQISAFLNLTRARIAEHQGDYAQAGTYLRQSIRQDWRRSSNYDLMVRLGLPWLFRKPGRIPDPLMIGPLALPFYLARGVF